MAIVKDGGNGSTTSVFANRAERFPLRMPVILTLDDDELHGHTVNISESGLLATFHQEPEVWLIGQLSIHLPNHTIHVSARIARVEGPTAAMSFRHLAPDDLLAIQRLLKKL